MVRGLFKLNPSTFLVGQRPRLCLPEEAKEGTAMYLQVGELCMHHGVAASLHHTRAALRNGLRALVGCIISFAHEINEVKSSCASSQAEVLGLRQ